MPTTPYDFTALPAEIDRSSSLPLADIEQHINKQIRTLKELKAAINGEDAGNDSNGAALESYLNNGIVGRLETLEGNDANSVTAYKLAYSIGVAGDRSYRMYLGNTSTYVGLLWDNTATEFQLKNQAGALRNLAIAEGTEDDHAITLSQLNSSSSVVPKRQCILSGHNAIVTTPTPGATGVTLDCTTANVALTAANGFSANGSESNTLEVISANGTATCKAGTTNYIMRNLSTNTWSATHTKPIYKDSISRSDTSLQYSFECNEGSGSTVADTFNGSDLSITGSPTWSTGYVQLAGNSTIWAEESTPTIAAHLTGNFATYCWVEFTSLGTVAQNRGFYGIRPAGGATGTTNVMFLIALDATTNYPQFYIGDSSNFSVLPINQACTTSVKYLMVANYKRVSSGSNNICDFWITSDGSTWYRAYSNTFRSMQVQDAYTFSTRPQGNNLYSLGAKYYKMEILPNGYISQDDAQAIWDAGSEATSTAQNDYFYNKSTSKMTYGNVEDGWTDTPAVNVGRVLSTDKGNSLLHFEGSDTSTTFTDECGLTWTAAGNAQIDTAQFKFGSSSLLLDGSGDYIYTSDTTYNMGDGLPWMQEGWFRFNAFAASTALFAEGSQHTALIYHNGSASTLAFYISSNGSSWNIANGATGSKSSWTTGQWYHIRWGWDGTTYFCYVDGVLDWSTANSSPVHSSCNQLWIGNYSPGGADFNGWFDEHRFIYGNAVNAAFTPESAAFTSLPFAELHSPTTNAILARYDSGVFTTAAGASNTYNHYIGTDDLMVTKLERYNSDYKWALNHSRGFISSAYYGSATIVDEDSVTITYDSTTTDYVGIGNFQGADSFPASAVTTGEARLIVERSW